MIYKSELQKVSTFEINPVYNLVFQNTNCEVGRLEFNSAKLVFKDDVEESSKYFIDFLCESFNQKIDELVNKRVNEYIDKQRAFDIEDLRNGNG